MVKWPWKRKNELLTAVKDLTQGVHSGFSLLAKKIDEMDAGFEPSDTNSTAGNLPSTADLSGLDLKQSGLDSNDFLSAIDQSSAELIKSYDNQLLNLSRKIATIIDPGELRRTQEAIKIIRSTRNQEVRRAIIQKVNRSGRNRYPREERYADEIIQSNGEVLEREGAQPDFDVDRLMPGVGVTPSGSLDLGKFAASAQKILSHPLYGGMIRKAAKNMLGIEDVDQFVELLKNPAVSNKVTAEIGDKFASLLQEKVKPLVQEWATRGHPNPITPTAQGQPNGEVIGQTINIPPIPVKMVNGLPVNGYDGFRLFRHPLGLVDPRRPYQTSQMGPVGQVM